MPISIQYGSPGAMMIGGLASGTYRSRRADEKEKQRLRFYQWEKEQERRARLMEQQQQQGFAMGEADLAWNRQVILKNAELGQRQAEMGFEKEKFLAGQAWAEKRQKAEMEFEGQKFVAGQAWQNQREHRAQQTAFGQSLLLGQMKQQDAQTQEAFALGRQQTTPEGKAVWSALLSDWNKINSLQGSVPPEEQVKMRQQWLNRVNEQRDVLHVLAPPTLDQQFATDIKTDKAGNSFAMDRNKTWRKIADAPKPPDMAKIRTDAISNLKAIRGTGMTGATDPISEDDIQAEVARLTGPTEAARREERTANQSQAVVDPNWQSRPLMSNEEEIRRPAPPPPKGMVSPDGKFVSDGTKWVPVGGMNP